MASERDFTSELAREIRDAVAEVSPRASSEPAPALPEERGFRLPLARAAEHLTPSIPGGSRLARGKKVVVRALKFLWRDQASFNALVIETVSGLADRVASLAQSLADALGEEREVRRREIEGLERWKEEFQAETRRRTAIQDGRLALLEAGGALARPGPGGEGGVEGHASAPLPPGVYSLFEERFRGKREEISEKQRSYLRFFKDLPGPVLDVGCGRGELLSLLAAEGIPASGIEVNPLAVASCRAEGLDVAEGDGLAALASRPEGSLGAVVALQVVEHWRVETTFAFLREARRALAPGGVLIAETINSDSLSALKSFFLDPSHVRPVPPDALLFLAEAAGFVDARIEYRSPMSSGDRLEEASANDAKLNRLLYGPQDYALIAHAPRAIQE